MNAARTERPAIKAEGLTKYYGKSRGITDLDLTVKRGEFLKYITPFGYAEGTVIVTDGCIDTGYLIPGILYSRNRSGVCYILQEGYFIGNTNKKQSFSIRSGII